MSEQEKRSVGYGSMKLNVRVAVVDSESGAESQVWEKLNDVGDVQLVQLMCANLFGAAQSSCVKDTSGTLRSIGAGASVTAVNVVAGTGGATATVTDYTLGAQVSGGAGSQSATVGAVNTSNGAVQLTANMSSPSANTTYTEIGIYVTVAGYTIQVARDYNGSGWAVASLTQFLQVTYTLTPS